MGGGGGEGGGERCAWKNRIRNECSVQYMQLDTSQKRVLLYMYMTVNLSIHCSG